MALFTDTIEQQPWKNLSSFTQIMCRLKKIKGENSLEKKWPAVAHFVPDDSCWNTSNSTEPAIKRKKDVCNGYFSLFVAPDQLEDYF